MNYTLQEVEDEITRIYLQAAQHAYPGISRLNPNEGMLGFWWAKFDELNDRLVES